MGSSSGVQVPRGADDRNHKPKPTAPPRGGVGERKVEAKLRPEEHKPHRRRGDYWARRPLTQSPWSSMGRRVKCGGCARRVAALSGETCRGVGLDACRPTPLAARRPVTRQELAEAVVAAGSCAAKGRTRSRGNACPCSRKPQQQTPPGGAFAQWMHRVKPEAPREERSGSPAPGEAQPHPAAANLWEKFLSARTSWRRSDASSKTPPHPVWMG